MFSDMTIHTTEHVLTVHKLALCAESEYFARLFRGNWPVSIYET